MGFSVMGQNGPSCGTQSIHCFDQHSTSATHISNTRHPQAHTHTCTLIPSVVFFFIHSLMRTCIFFTNDSRRGEACLSGVQQTECCHTVESNTTDESCRECANMQTETQGDGETKTESGGCRMREKRGI